MSKNKNSDLKELALKFSTLAKKSSKKLGLRRIQKSVK